MKFPKSLQNKLYVREENNALRSLTTSQNLMDFATNDYLGFSKNEEIFNKVHQLLLNKKIIQNGATGSRLLTGNHELFQETESFIAQFHQSDCALLFNSGYDANVGFFSAVPQRNDIILYDELCHASIRDGIQLSLAKSYKFLHNDLTDLETLLLKFKLEGNQIYIVTESVFSMDGDSPDLENIVTLSEKHNALLVVDEAHALAVLGNNGEGLVQELQLQDKIFARVMTFGKGLGCHGAAILGSIQLKQYLINFCRSFIYTTALPPHAVATILVAYQELNLAQDRINKLKENSKYFDKNCSNILGYISNNSSIKSIVISGNSKVKETAQCLQNNGFDVKPILSPTVPEGQERLRFCLHSYNSKDEIKRVLELLYTFV
ncbi:pyridoxal phosphate-dependent aminotransferase family protein [Flavobacterium sp.]|jgi:8-amino-7-oxononanoate synthase|uniref:aminotransferase class I/II-fold pyridoxal phosphate-dependent enzyme n=1 Tax=Flavobacterium sp. TaxID=239 RepID=UPI002A82B162|nr:pyridoxal phosphate-dependent aminotransferase family protein [Flavobacterium sp.]